MTTDINPSMSAEFAKKAEEMRQRMRDATSPDLRQTYEDLANQYDLIAQQWRRLENEFLSLSDIKPHARPPDG